MEIWKPTNVLGQLYEVSNTGRVRSVDRVIKSKLGKDILREGRVLKTNITKGYVQAVLIARDERHQEKVHRLVAMAFIPNPDGKEFINHINGVKHDNRVENLEWCTKSENTAHAHRTGLIKTMKGATHPTAKLSNETVIRIYNEPGIYKNVALKYGTTQENVSAIKTGRTWSHVTGHIK